MDISLPRPQISASDALLAAESSFTPAPLPTSAHSVLHLPPPTLQVGLITGCVFGATFGWTVGIGPSRLPFAHAGAYPAFPTCGVVAGVSLGFGPTVVLGYRVTAPPGLARAFGAWRTRGGGGSALRGAGLALRQVAGRWLGRARVAPPAMWRARFGQRGVEGLAPLAGSGGEGGWGQGRGKRKGTL